MGTPEPKYTQFPVIVQVSSNVPYGYVAYNYRNQLVTLVAVEIEIYDAQMTEHILYKFYPLDRTLVEDHLYIEEAHIQDSYGTSIIL